MNLKDFETNYKPTWCPGCGNHAIWIAMRGALAELGLKPENVLIFYGIGCSGNGANFTKSYTWHSLHGRAVPSAIGAKLANKDLTVIVMAGDGDAFGEGLGHFLHAIRGNADITYVVHDNHVYGLTTGQAAPTADKGYKAKSTPAGIIEVPVNPTSLAVTNGGTFVSRGFSGNAKHLKGLFKQAITHKGFSFVDVFQPCVTFNKINTFEWFFDRVYNVDDDATYKNTDKMAAFGKTQEWGKKIPYGVLYKAKRDTYGSNLPQLKGQALSKRKITTRNLDKLTKEFA
ncbi:2-oxoacid:ferredoxin oxidoreductase subunit beta [Candidatus Parcubacteria bacterium]|jgi:2-oxoglutarate ferredoxin oxidoreductase subunit beta|nr:2-oxoacid:ferredoxin oxidoreductase subunit beta [Candidatus Parcubacteria bacterium]MBT7227921.1 2-oxoacid:ferredoxin oxidoreductase subunit beta [Candidatus Parcubacteria bacterium]